MLELIAHTGELFFGFFYLLAIIVYAIVVMGLFLVTLYAMLYHPICKYFVYRGCPRITYKQFKNWYSVNPDAWTLSADGICYDDQVVIFKSHIAWLVCEFRFFLGHLISWLSYCKKSQKETTIDVLEGVQEDVQIAMKRAEKQFDKGKKMLESVPAWKASDYSKESTK